MGIDKADVRFVVHFCLSKNIEGYYQEAGRAGRDNADAECVIMYNSSDVVRVKRILMMQGQAELPSGDRCASSMRWRPTARIGANADASLLRHFGGGSGCCV